MDNIIYLKKVPFPKKFFGFVIMLAGISVAMFSNMVLGTIFAVIGLNLLSTEGTEINFIDKKYRIIKSVLGIHFGKWQDCPKFEYVSVFKTKQNQTVRVITAETTIQSDIILLNLFYANNKYLTFYKTDNKEDAFKVANHFNMIFDVDILDATESESKWIEPIAN
ncbi:MAG: hypothetical protein ABIQ27_13145 [Flavobacterium sp.]|uniref:hypothetical protein n=1 Tax=Flavobacterium sp. TaxID=239 RepID=UPI003266CC5D